MDKQEQLNDMARIIMSKLNGATFDDANDAAGALQEEGYCKFPAIQPIFENCNPYDTSDTIERFEADVNRITTALAKAYDIIVQTVAKTILDDVSKHYGGAWLVELYKKYGIEVQ